MDLSKLNYENRIVAFIDLLGFKEKVKDSITSTNALNDIKLVLSHLYEEYEKNKKQKEKYGDDLFEINVFSDSIVYSSPITHDYDAYYVLVMIEYLLRELVELGFLARGGITIGQMIHSKGIVFGPAYIEAYRS